MARTFDAALAEFGREAAPAPGPAPGVRGLPDVAPSGGHHSLWEAAQAWTPEADPPPPRAEPAPAPPSERPEDVAAELRLSSLLSPGDVARARRRFMWDNHPDRTPAHGLALANRRVAIANMLLDRALASLPRDAKPAKLR